MSCVRCAPEVLEEKVIRRGISVYIIAERQKPVCDQYSASSVKGGFGAKGDELSTIVVQKPIALQLRKFQAHRKLTRSEAAAHAYAFTAI